jgi:hypothetical protein
VGELEQSTDGVRCDVFFQLDVGEIERSIPAGRISHAGVTLGDAAIAAGFHPCRP